MKDSKKLFIDRLKYALSIIVAGVLLYFSFRGVKWEDFAQGVRNCKWEFLAVSMAAGICAFFVRALRWRDLLRPIDSSLSVKSVFNAINIGYIANFVFPRIGEFVRCGVITDNSERVSDEEHTKKASYDKVLGTVVLERSWDMLSMIFFMVLMLVFSWEKFGSFFLDQMWKPLISRFSMGIWVIVTIVVALVILGLWFIVRYSGKNQVLAKIRKVAAGLFQGLGSCMKMEGKWRFFFYTIVIWGLYWLMSFSTMKALPELASLNASDALFLMLAGSLGWLIPVPGGFGAFHFVVSLALSTIYGIPFEVGIIFATLSHESQAVTMAACGGISYFSELFRKNRNN